MFSSKGFGRPSRALVLGALVALTASVVVASGVSAKPAPPGPGNSPSAKACQKGGYGNLVRSNATGFQTEAECKTYAAGGGTLYNANEVPCLNGGWQNWVNANGADFSDQAGCVAFVRGGGTLVAYTVVAPCLNDAWANLARSADYSGFASEQECRSYAVQGGTLVNPLALCKQQLAAAGLTEPANANYILGTPGDDDFTSQMTAGNDVVCGFGGNDDIDVPHATTNPNGALVAGDVFLGGEGADFVHTVDGGTFEGGAGDDRAAVLDGGTFNGGDGDDLLSLFPLGSDGTFNGGAGADIVVSMYGGTFNGGGDHDRVDGYCSGTTNDVEEVKPGSGICPL